MQPDGISCGNTCLKMVFEYLDIHKSVSIPEIVKVCGTNSEHGTRHIEMSKGLKFYNIPFRRTPLLNIDNSDKQLDYLDTILKNDNVFLLRTLTHNIFHWVIVTGKTESRYHINDPWLGSITYTCDEVINIWEPRNYDGFEILLNNSSGSSS
jgi:ABC-type bacteriocin/lantibiotic exporter with double-glycine peptidase domain